jgi:predicted ABC-type ATPase
LASRSFAPWLRRLIEGGYRFHLFFFWVPTAEFSIARVQQRVRTGGHDVDAETIQRRYERGLRNFFALYQPLTESWFMYNNSKRPAKELIARGRGRIVDEIACPLLWTELVNRYDPTCRQEG